MPGIARAAEPTLACDPAPRTLRGLALDRSIERSRVPKKRAACSDKPHRQAFRGVLDAAWWPLATGNIFAALPPLPLFGT